jgi:hypothetical protein
VAEAESERISATFRLPQPTADACNARFDVGADKRQTEGRNESVAFKLALERKMN